jgi:hypothetical protein
MNTSLAGKNTAINQMILMHYISMDIMSAPYLVNSNVGNEYWWAVSQAAEKYYKEDAFLIDIKPYDHSVSLIPDSRLNKSFSVGHHDAFKHLEFREFLRTLRPRELVIFGVMPDDTITGAVTWAENKENTSIIIRSDLCRFLLPKKDEANLISLSKPPKVRIYPKDFLP